jgi:calcium-dependent protein kinase
MVDIDLKVKKMMFIQSREGKLENYYNVNLVTDVIGSGGFANVVKATTKEGNEPRAIKVLRKVKITYKDKFKSEIEILKQLDHPNVLNLYEVFEDYRNVYLVTDLCKGGELFDRIIAKGHFTESEARKVFIDMVRAVSYCHSHGICHRDLKPENFIYLDKKPDSHLKLIDFGLASTFSHQVTDTGKSNTAMTAQVGSVYYIAPEVLEGSYDESCDIWSLGVIFYTLLSGLRPFRGGTEDEILENICKRTYTLDGPEWENVSESAKDLIKHMLCKPNERLTAKEVLHHSWMLQEASHDEEHLHVNFERLKGFANAQRLKKIALTMIASQMSEEDIIDLSELFEKLDTSGNGTLTVDEIREGLEEFKDRTSSEFTPFIDSIDTDKDGTVDYTEFIAATMQRNLYLKEEKLMAVFKMLDKDGNGKITAEDLKNVLEAHDNQRMNMGLYEKMIKDADQNGDGVIDYHDFVEMMQTD